MSERVAGSFRDPAGFVFRRDGVVFRQVNHSHREHYDACERSGLYAELHERGLLIRHAVVDVTPPEPALGDLVIKPEQIPFISYPYEWAPGQLRAAAELTLEIQRIALERGFVLRDASAYNVQFLAGKPVFIDTLSFEPRVEGEPWIAYGQFCRHFLAPLALARYCDPGLARLARVEIDGIPLELAARTLPWRTRLGFGLGLHLHAHARSQRQHAGGNADSSTPISTRKVSRQALLGLVDSLMSVTRKQVWKPSRTAWRDYYSERQSYSDSSFVDKEAILREVLSGTEVRSVWDFGANTGRFSRLAASVTGSDVLALEMDVAAVELNWLDDQTIERGTVLPLWVDLANPSPAQGWAHDERQSLAARGPADVGLALALVHHLAIGNNVPLDSVLAWFAGTVRTLVIEWIPKDDPMVHRLLATREDTFADYSTESFERAVSVHFSVRERRPVADSLRTLYVLDRR